jgi:hypothetical protein
MDGNPLSVQPIPTLSQAGPRGRRLEQQRADGSAALFDRARLSPLNHGYVCSYAFPWSGIKAHPSFLPLHQLVSVGS